MVVDRKVPIKIVQVKDMHGNKHIGAMLDIQYYNNAKGNPSEKIKKFEGLYFETIKKAKDLYDIKGKRGNSRYYWKLGNILRNFNEKTETEFEITNYRTALQRDFGITDSYIGVLFDFCKLFKEDEIIDIIPMSVYFEFTLKARKLEKLGLLNEEKDKLFKLADQGKIPDHKGYRKMLSELIKKVSNNP